MLPSQVNLEGRYRNQEAWESSLPATKPETAFHGLRVEAQALVGLVKIILNYNTTVSGQDSTLKSFLQRKEVIKPGRNVKVKQLLVGGHKPAVPVPPPHSSLWSQNPRQ